MLSGSANKKNRKEGVQAMPARKKSEYFPLFMGGKYTIAKKSIRRPDCSVVNDGICGYYIFQTFKDAAKACRIINKSKILKDIVFSNEEDAGYFREHETDGSMFVEYILLKTS